LFGSKRPFVNALVNVLKVCERVRLRMDSE
jgi:hypothetical protein